MAGSANTFLLLTILILVTILLVFAMKYAAAARQSRMRSDSEDAYRNLAEQAVAAQAETATTMASVQSDLSKANTRLSAIEKMLREVE